MRGQRHAPAALYPQERPGTHSTGGWVGPRTGLDRCENLAPTEIRSADRPARSQSLYRLHYVTHLDDSRGLNIRSPVIRHFDVLLTILRSARMRTRAFIPLHFHRSVYTAAIYFLK